MDLSRASPPTVNPPCCFLGKVSQWDIFHLFRQVLSLYCTLFPPTQSYLIRLIRYIILFFPKTPPRIFLSQSVVMPTKQELRTSVRTNNNRFTIMRNFLPFHSLISLSFLWRSAYVVKRRQTIGIFSSHVLFSVEWRNYLVNTLYVGRLLLKLVSIYQFISQVPSN